MIHSRASIKILAFSLIVALVSVILPPLTVRASTQTLTFTPTADAYVIKTHPDTNFGTNLSLRVDESPVTRSYLQFNVKGLNASSVQSAKLRIYANSKSDKGYTVRSEANNTWQETKITFKNSPAQGNIIGRSKPFAGGGWVEADVSSYVKGEGKVSLVLTTSSETDTNLAARESGGHTPQLVIVVSSSSPTTAPTATTKPTTPPAPTGTAAPTRPAATSTPVQPTSTFAPTQPKATSTPTRVAPTPTQTQIAPTPTKPAPTPTQPAPTPVPTQPASGGDAVLVGAGDIARCDATGDEATAALINKISGKVMAIGDTAYTAGTPTQFTDCYNPSWGQFKSRTSPAVGNHEYGTSGASGYFNYFGAAAGPSGKGYYSYDLGSWHVVVLNSECSHVGGCGAGSVEETWLKADLAAHPNACTLAYWHEPRYSSGEHGNNTGMQTFWQDLYNAGAELVLSGHDHDYERFAPMNASGSVDNAKGVRQIVVGTGGGNLRAFGAVQANSQVRIANVYGVLKLTLHAGSYDWQFIPVAGQTASDSGSAVCH
ncbi:MAG: DNRLRE domain-containing protein [Chloroflexi bacterium]|nr:DNRLRE domain-containing protein [Chloroflexota bacterium]